MAHETEKPFAEIIESSLSEWTAQSWDWDNFPSFASIVTITKESKTLIGIVHKIETGSLDSTRFPMAYKKTEEELRAQMPHIFEFLKTNFSCIPLGYIENGVVQYTTLPKPPKIHAFISHATPLLYKQFFASSEYLHMIYSQASHVLNIDELIISLIKKQTELKIVSQQNLPEIIKTYSLITNNDYRKIRIFLQRIEHMLK